MTTRSNLSNSPLYRGDLQLVTAPSGDVVTLTEAKRHLKVDDTARDDDITSFLAAAVDQVQKDTRRQLLTATWRLNLRQWTPLIEIPKGPVASIASITYVDTNGDTQTLDPSLYQVQLYSQPVMIRPAWGQTWPVVRPDESAIQVNFVAGYGNAAAVPALLKSAIKLIVEGLFYGNENMVRTPVADILRRYEWDAL